MIEVERNIAKIDWHEAERKLEELTGWSSARMGIWNADFTKPVVFSVDFSALPVYHHEQDLAFVTYPFEQPYKREITEDPESLLQKDETGEYKGQIFYNIYPSDVILWLRIKGEINVTPEDSVLVTTFSV